MNAAEFTSFMQDAIRLARNAQETGEVPVGAVVVHDGAIIGRGHNRTKTDHDPSAHAEIMAMREAARHLGSERLTGCDLWVTLEPCTMCAGAISHARINRLYYAAADPKGGAIENGVRFFDTPSCHHRPELYTGMMEKDAAALLKGFFAARRK